VSRLEEAQAKLAAKKAARDAAADEQLATDLEARLCLEDEHEVLAAVSISRHVKGHPVQAYVRAPTPAEYKRYRDQFHRAYKRENIPEQQKAQDLLGRTCWVYPAAKEAQDAMAEAFPGLVTQLAVAASALAEGKAEAEGKG